MRWARAGSDRLRKLSTTYQHPDLPSAYHHTLCPLPDHLCFAVAYSSPRSSGEKGKQEMSKRQVDSA